MNEIQSLQLAHPDAPDRPGSVCALVQGKSSNDRFLLTCSHVALGGSAVDRKGLLPNPEEIDILEKGRRIETGDLTYARLNRTTDVALVRVEGAISQRFNRVPNLPELKAPISRTALKKGQKIGFYSSLDRQVVWGKIEHPTSVDTVNLSYGNVICPFDGLIVLRGTGLSGMSTPGDSGCLLFTENYEPFGMLIAGGKGMDYALPLLELLQLTNCTFIDAL